MKRNIIILSFLISAGLLSACSGDHVTTPGTTDSLGNYAPTNAYRDTFKTTHTYGNATTEDNSGSGGTGLVKPLQPVAKADTTGK